MLKMDARSLLPIAIDILTVKVLIRTSSYQFTPFRIQGKSN